MIGASGMFAAWARPLIAAALASAVAVPRKFLRDNMGFSISVPAAAGCLCGRRGSRFGLGTCAAAAVDRGLQFGLCEPEVPLGFEGGAQRCDPLPRLGQQGEYVDLHAAETQLHLIRDDLAQRQDLALVVTRDVVSRSVDPEGVACLGPDVHGLFGQQVESLILGLAGLPNADLAAVEDR